MNKQVWVYDSDKRAFRLVNSNRLESGVNCPPGMLRMWIRKPNKWVYVHWANTKLECWLAETAYERANIERMKKQVIEYEESLVKRYGPEPTQTDY